MKNQEFQIYWLTHASQEAVYSWLEEKRPKKNEYNESIKYYDSEDIEKALLKRREPLVMLGLALFGRESNTGLYLYENGDELIQKAVLSGSTITKRIFGHSSIRENENGILSNLLENKKTNFLAALLSNAYIDADLLVDFFEKKGLFKNIEDHYWLELCQYVVNNERLSTPYEGNGDGYDEDCYYEVVKAGWKLFGSVPVSDKSASLLANLGESLPPIKPWGMNVKATIARWERETTNNYYNNYQRCRTHLANLIDGYGSDFQLLKESEDIALRESYYGRFSPKSTEEVRALFAKDDSKFLDCAVFNVELYKKVDIREELRCCCSDCKDDEDNTFPRIFRSQCEDYEGKYPEWFEGQDGEVLFDSIKDPLERANKNLKHIGQKVTKLSKKILESKDDEKPIFDDLRASLHDIRVYLYELKNSPKNNYGWFYAIGAFAIGYLSSRW